MNYRNRIRQLLETNAREQSFGLASGESESPRRLAHRSITITERRNAEVIERKAGVDSAPLFAYPPKPAESAQKWQTERTFKIEETFE